MSLFRTVQLCAVLAVIAGCRTPQPRTVVTSPITAAPSLPVRLMEPTSAPAAVAPVAFHEPLPPASVPDDYRWLCDDDGELSLPRLIAEVETQNPSLQATIAAWRAAAERYPQVIALDDPMFTTMLAPASFDSSQVESAYVLEGAQKVPWFGKRAARGRVAQAEASAAGQDARQARLLLDEMVQFAFLDYYLVRRRQELNRDNAEVAGQFRGTAKTKYLANQVTQRDVLQADVELSQLDRRRIELDRSSAVAVARINTLLRRPPGASLPPPPAELESPPLTAEVEFFQQLAASQRPDVAAAAARVRAEQASLALASQAYYPDVEVFGRYDSFWQPRDTQSDLRGQVGVRLNVPVYHDRLRAAVREATYRLSQRQAEYQQKLLDVQYEVQTTHAELEEARQALSLYDRELLPAAQQFVRAARADYDVGKGSFLDLALAQRQYWEMREKQEELLAASHRRLAELARAVGGSLPASKAVEELPPAAPQ